MQVKMFCHDAYLFELTTSLGQMYENSYLSTKMVFRLAIHIFEVSDIPTFRSPYLHFKMDAKRQEISTFHAVIPQDVSIPSDSLYFLRQQNKNLHSFSMKFLLFFFFFICSPGQQIYCVFYNPELWLSCIIRLNRISNRTVSRSAHDPFEQNRQAQKCWHNSH